jgi:formate hydrogenlyase transcriptional activator
LQIGIKTGRVWQPVSFYSDGLNHSSFLSTGNLPVKKRIFITLAIIIFGVCAFLFNSFYKEAKNTAITKLNEEQMIHAKQAARGIEDFFATWTRSLNFLSKMDAVIDNDSVGQRYMKLFYEANQESIESITRLDERGVIIYNFPSNGSIGTDISGQKHVIELLRDHKAVISDVFKAVEGFDSIALHVPIFSRSVFRGSVGILINFKSLAKRYLDVIQIGETGYAWVVSRDGTQLYSPIQGFTGKSVLENIKGFPSMVVMVNDMLKGHEGAATYTFDRVGDRNMGQIRKYATYLPIQIGNTFWSIAVASDEQDVLSGLISFRNKLLFVIGAIFVFGLVFSALGIKAWFIVKEEEKRKKAEKALRESEARLNLAAASANAGMWSMSADTWQVWATDKIRELFDFPPHEELRFKSFLGRIHPEDREWVHQTMQQAMQSGEELIIEYRVLRADGSVRWIASRGRLRQATAGNPSSMMGVSVDISERKDSEEELKEAYLEIRKLKERLEAESAYLQEEIKTEHNFENIVGMSDALKYVLYRVAQVAATDSTALILGETGTGKELIARAIHSTGKRHGRALIKVNCATLPANLIESELFGHEKGAFTGANTKKLGRFELAHQATLFLDEIGELSLDLQSKLLRVIEEGEFERLGSSKTIKVDVRVIAATNRNLEKEMQAGRFREDLWYRLNVFTITVPPLRERTEDIPLLVKHFVDFFNKAFGKSLNKIPTSVIESLQRYHWPGNVRELKHVIERAAINSAGNTMQLAEAFAAPALSPSVTADDSASVSFLSLEEVERQHTLRVLAKVGWKIEGKGGAADILDINPGTLRSRMKKLGIRKPQ